MFRAIVYEFREAARMAGGALAAHKLRSGLTLLAVLVGVFSIIVVMTAIRVLQGAIESELSQLGKNSFEARKWPAAFFENADYEKIRRRKNIDLDLGRLVQNSATTALNVGLENSFWQGSAISLYGQSAPTARLLGETTGSFPARNWLVAEGRGLTEADVQSARNVCVLGAGLAKSLFPFGWTPESYAELDGVRYRVVGWLLPRGLRMGGDQDQFAAIPITTGLNHYGRAGQSLSIMVQAPSDALFDDTVGQVRGILRAARHVPPAESDDFEISSNDSLIHQFQQFTAGVRLGAAIISSIALLAAGVGIMNIMLVSVTERTREIGIRRAVGAKKRHIMSQFLLEAIVLCQAGGVAGVGLGVVGGNAAALFLKLPPVIPWDWAFLGLLLCCVVGLLFGTYPAYKAAHLDPIESLRYE